MLFIAATRTVHPSSSCSIGLPFYLVLPSFQCRLAGGRPDVPMPRLVIQHIDDVFNTDGEFRHEKADGHKDVRQFREVGSEVVLTVSSS